MAHAGRPEDECRYHASDIDLVANGDTMGDIVEKLKTVRGRFLAQVHSGGAISATNPSMMRSWVQAI